MKKLLILFIFAVMCLPLLIAAVPLDGGPPFGDFGGNEIQVEAQNTFFNGDPVFSGGGVAGNFQQSIPYIEGPFFNFESQVKPIFLAPYNPYLTFSEIAVFSNGTISPGKEFRIVRGGRFHLRI